MDLGAIGHQQIDSLVERQAHHIGRKRNGDGHRGGDGIKIKSGSGGFADALVAVFDAPATDEIYTLCLQDALPI